MRNNLQRIGKQKKARKQQTLGAYRGRGDLGDPTLSNSVLERHHPKSLVVWEERPTPPAPSNHPHPMHPCLSWRSGVNGPCLLATDAVTCTFLLSPISAYCFFRTYTSALSMTHLNHLLAVGPTSRRSLDLIANLLRSCSRSQTQPFTCARE